MSKLPTAHKFVDLSDYGRPAAKIIAHFLKTTRYTPIHVTLAFTVSGLVAVWAIIMGHAFTAALFLILKSILDAADGELARIKKTPSHTGRYLDSVADICLNAVIFLAIWYSSSATIWLTILAFMGVQLQGTLYNYYYVILRNRFGGDTTSRVFENKTPLAFDGEKKKNVDILYKLYSLLYAPFDKTIYFLDSRAAYGKLFPNWLMTAVSTFGLGFQLLVIAVLLVVGLQELIIPFFVAYTGMIVIFIAIRKGIYT